VLKNIFQKKHDLEEKTLYPNTLGINEEKHLGDYIFYNVTRFFAFFVLLLMAVMFAELFIESLPSINKFGLSFITSTVWDPVAEEYGALPFIFGTIYSSILALMLALPLSIGVAVFLTEISPKWLEGPVSILVELLAAIPSIVYGLFGIFVLAPFLRTVVQPFLQKYFGFLPFFKGDIYGFGMLSAALILSIMIIPIITSISRDVLKAIPDSIREGAYGLGATKWESIKIVLHSSQSGIFGATLLGFGRAIGETMAVTMVIGNRPEISFSLFNAGHTMASVLANEFTEATSALYVSSLIEIGLLFFIITLIINSIARLIVNKVTNRYNKIS